MTAVEWLFEKIWNTPKDKFSWYSILDEAKEMEKQQIIYARDSGIYTALNTTLLNSIKSSIESIEEWDEEVTENRYNNIEIKKMCEELSKEINSRQISYYGDLSDLGNEVGYALGNILKNMNETEISDFITGLKHGISLTNGTH